MSDNNSKWVKHGECDACGFCCETQGLVEFHIENDDQEFFKVRGFDKNGKKLLHVIDPCSMLCEDKKCAIYDRRPKTCRDFPAQPEQLIGLPCTYWFENEETGEKIGGTRSPFPTEFADED